MLKVPSSPAVADFLAPPGRVTSTVEPASALPVIASSPALTGFTLGASGAVLSAALPTVAVVGADVLFEASVAVTEISSFSFKPDTGMLKVPSSPAVAVTFLPFGNMASTVELASAVPVILVAPALTVFTFGAVGGVVSGFASTLISFHPVGLEYLFSLIFEMTLALPAWICSFISSIIVSTKPSEE